ncbi:hypothetical protein Leryth_001376 [Lithospermum erythrorhizon]|nr:hypothetical protein Leryth_001376 [Lithospermum erythrorhizon]
MVPQSQLNQTIDPKNGYSSATKTYQSLRPNVTLPPLSHPLSITQFALSLLHSTTPTPTTTAFLIDAATNHHISYTQFFSQTNSLSFSLKTKFPSLSQKDVAFIICPPSLHVPIIYFSLLSLGIVVSPANPLSSSDEVEHMMKLCKPSIVFSTFEVSKKLPYGNIPIVNIESNEFIEMLSEKGNIEIQENGEINQLDSAAILYSSGTTGRVKGVELSHRNFIAVIGGMYDAKYRAENDLGEGENGVSVSLFTLPLFHVFGFFMLIRSLALGETLVMLGRFDFEKMLMAVEKYKVTYIPVSPPLVVAMLKSPLVSKYDLSSLKLLGCGGAPLGSEVSEGFRAKFPEVEIVQGYGMTETGGGATRMIGPEETSRYGSVGRLAENMEAKIVDPDSGEALPPGQRGELWLRGPIVMKGYIGDDKATAATLDSEGWLRTGDLCYFDTDGFLYIVDRLKELIKYKAYQVPPAELEHILQSIPNIADAAVIPYPDEAAGQIPMAYIVRKPGSTITEADVMNSVSKKVAPYKKIRRVAFINAIPKSPAGKILRRELVNHAVSGSAKL